MKLATYTKTTMDKKNEEVMSRVWRSLNRHQDLEKMIVLIPTDDGAKEFEFWRVRPNKRVPSELKAFVLKRFGINPFKS